MTTAPVTAALFDLDGTLLDSRAAVIDAYRLAARAYPNGLENLAAIPEGRLLAMRVIECCALIAGPALAEDCAVRYDENYRLRTRKKVQVYPGVVEALAALRTEGIRLGVVTNKGLARTPGDIAPLDGHGNGAELFDVVVTAADTVERKPSPRPIQWALEKTGWAPGWAVYVGDGPHDAQSAFGAGLSFVGAGWGYYGLADLKAAGADVVCQDVGELVDAVRGALGAGI
ncbi:HAD hydrolase-like protein [Blastococcus sp. HT6-30]|uniref:HAD family hydrolase n=1 Tax=Blastococcus sp. HT6-30 TaxID=3144843 RepID=UPI00321BFF59